MQEATFSCPDCQKEIRWPRGQAYTICPTCKVQMDVKAVLAFQRGLEAFEEGQSAMEKSNPRKRRLWEDEQEKKAIKLFREAYSSIQLAFEGDLLEHQRQLGIEMMASMAQEFSVRLMVSPYEGQYWRAVMAEMTSQNEYHALKRKLRLTRTTTFNILTVWYWHRRQAQLLNVLKELKRKLARLEEQIDFVQPPRARNRNWTP